ncbi:MAG: nucleotide exchange factor GrpE [Thermodesulfovibrionales bacterium]
MPMEEDKERMALEGAGAGGPETRAEGEPALEDELKETRDKYLRLYAEFENYKKRVARDREELLKYSTESLIHELLTSVDHLEIALRHVSEENSSALVEGVEMTLRELQRTLEKFGLRPIEAIGKPFDPNYHHAMSQVERDDVEEGMVVEEMRKGYMLHDKVLRAPLVAVSKRPSADLEKSHKIEINKGSKEDS